MTDQDEDERPSQGASKKVEAEEEEPPVPVLKCPITVCKFTDLKENQMKLITIEETVQIILIKQKGEIRAIGPTCPHRGAPLIGGVLGVGRIRCPWHGACFSTKTGDIEDFPGLDSIPTYQVRILLNGDVKLMPHQDGVDSEVRMREMTPFIECDKRTFVIIGGGPAAAVCAETLRQEGYSGRIVVLCKEKFPPYDRVIVSKRLNAGIKELRLREPTFYKDNGIEILTNSPVNTLDTRISMLTYKKKNYLRYDKLFIATGNKPFIPDMEDADKVQNIITIRELADARSLHKNLKRGKKVVIFGTSFIALEVASYLATRVNTVIMIGRSEYPFQEAFGPEIGKRLLELLQDNQIQMYMNDTVDRVLYTTKGKKKKQKKILKAIVLESRKRIPCEILIVACGAVPNTNFLKGSGLKINENGTITTDPRLMSNIDGVYIGGDIANAPVYSIGNKKAAIGHFQIAQYHGQIAAINMAGRCKSVHVVPFFNTMFFDQNFKYAGHGEFTDVYIEGDLEDLDFNGYLLDEDDYVVAVVQCGSVPVASAFAELQWQGQKLHRLEVADRTSEWQRKLLEREELDLNKCKLNRMECLRHIY